MDLLDRVAVACNDYLAGGKRPNQMHFRSYWAKTSGRDQGWLRAVRDEIAAGNRDLMALADLAFDLDEGGYLSDYRQLRNASTHRFVVLHDEAFGESRPSEAVEHVVLADFENQLVSTLRIARAAILYLLGMIAEREQRVGNDGATRLQLHVPDHHEIRGE